MNHISFRFVSFLLGLAALTAVNNTMSVRAATPSTDSAIERSAPVGSVESTEMPAATVKPIDSNSTLSARRSESAAAPLQGVEPVTPVATTNPLVTHLTDTQISSDTVGEANVQKAKADTNKYQADSQVPQPEVIPNDQQPSSNIVEGAVPSKQPIPGTLATSANLLTAPPQTSSRLEMPSSQADSTVAQTEVRPGQATRGGSSYIGIGGNIGFTGGTASGNGAFVVNSKIGLTRNISVRPSVIIADDVDFLIPVTYDFVIESADPFAPVPFAPFVGGGVAFSTNDEDNFGFLVTGGVDVPLSREFVANATLNAAFIEGSTNVGLVIGVGYTFPNVAR